MLSVLDEKTSSSLVEGHYVHKRIDASTIQSCHMKLDPDGMFIIWTYPIKKEIESLELTHIREIRIGHSIKDNKGSSQLADLEVYSDKLISIMYGFEIQNLSVVQFIASSVDVAVLWTKGLNQLLYNTLNRHLCFQQVLKKQWKRLCYSTNSKGLIPVRRIVKIFGHDKSEKMFYQKAKKAGFNLQKNDELEPDEFTFEQFKKMYQVICPRTDVTAVFNKICRGNSKWVELKYLMEWLNNNQRDPRSNEILVPFFDAKRTSAIINQYEPDKGLSDKNCLSAEGFENYLQSRDNDLIYTDHAQLNMDMTKPLSHYFINSSHNTYLTGHQFGGKSSVDIYRHVLLSGCRCIELDCWDGKGDMSGEPIITHGKAMCTDVVFRDVLVAIRETAFVASEYPVILSFETHCSKPMQMKMADYCEEVFGDLLLNKNLEAFPLEPGVPLPSPEHLKRKILIKNKRLPQEPSRSVSETAGEADEGNASNGGGGGANGENNEVEASANLEIAHPEQLIEKTDPIEEDQSSTALLPAEKDGEKAVASDQNGGSLQQNQPQKRSSSITAKSEVTKTTSVEYENIKTKTGGGGVVISPATEDSIDKQEIMRNYVYVKTSYTNIHPKLSALVNYCQSVKFPGFKKIREEKVESRNGFHMSSFNEVVALNHIKNNASEFVDYNKRQMSRIYPKGSRVDSSNYLPYGYWDAGCQMVSLNFQTHDLGMQLNSGKFEYNGNCGYLLKPDILTADSRFFDPFFEVTIDGVIAASCTVEVISALFLSEKPQNTQVEVEMYGLPNDTIRKEFKTVMTLNNSLNPSYTNNVFGFRKVICPDLALLRFAVLDDRREIIGQRVIPFSSLQAGYRYVGLRSASSIPLDNATIFVKITLGSYVPASMQRMVDALTDPCRHQTSIRNLLKNIVDSDMEDEVDDEDGTGAASGGGGGETNVKLPGRPSSKSKPSSCETSKAIVPRNNDPSNGSNFNQEQTSGRKINGEGGSGGSSTKENTSSSAAATATTNNNSYLMKGSDSISNLYSKDIAEELLERTVSKNISLEELRQHRSYMYAVHGKKKSSKKYLQKQSVEKISQADPPRRTCCWPGSMVFCKKRSSNRNDSKKEGLMQQDLKSSPSISKVTTSDHETTSSSALEEIKRQALISALNSIHEENRSEIVKLQDKETSEMKRNQTKVWIKRKKEVSKDPKIPSSERDRRIRELQGQEVRKFMDERELLKARQAKQLSRLETCQKSQTAELIERIKTTPL